ncbi:MAG TPA: hypothetical protein VGH97_04285 [Thermoanaerobaculia bacterium]|jgi:hypothetical protein
MRVRSWLAAAGIAGIAGIAAARVTGQPAPPPASPFQQVSQKFDYKPVKQIQAIQLGLEKIQVRQIVFAPASEAGGKQRHSVPEAVLSIDNDGPTTEVIGVAIAIFDADGNLLAAGCAGARQGWLAAGEKGTASIRFPFVYRSLDKAKTFQLTLEILPKSSRGAEAEGTAAR